MAMTSAGWSGLAPALGLWIAAASVAFSADGGAAPEGKASPPPLAGQGVPAAYSRDKLLQERAEIEASLAKLKAAKGEAWREGHLERAQACLKASALPENAAAEKLAAARERIEDARVIVEAIEAGRRPDPLRESVEHPAGFAADGPHGPVEFVPASGDVARLTIEAAEETPWQVSPLVYGTFSEPLNFGFPIYRNLHAQKLFNPSFEPGCPPLAALEGPLSAWFDMSAAGAIAKGQWLPIIPAKQQQVASPWLAVGQGEARFSLAAGAYNSEQCQKIEAATGARGVGVAQPVELQAWRCGRYRLRCLLRCEGSAQGVSAVLYHDAKALGRAGFESVGQEWRAFEAEFQTPIVSQEKNAFLLAIVFDGPGTLFIDQATLNPADAIDGFDPQALEQIRAMKTGWIRWPGGNYASGYHWRDGVGPVDKRPTRKNPAWKGIDPNHVGTDEYLRLCELAGLEPFICVNAGNGTPEEAADWVEYCNGSPETPLGRLRAENGHPEPYGVRYWNIGNEMWGAWQIGHCGPEEYAARYEAFTRAMRRRDPSIRFVACGLGPLGGENERRWNGALMDRMGKDLEALDFHTYIRLEREKRLDAVGKIETLAAMPAAYEQALIEFRRLCLDRGLGQIRVDAGEYNSQAIPGLPPRLMVAGHMLAFAGWLHTFMRQSEYVMGANATEFTLFNPRAGQFDTHHPRYELFKLYAAQAGSQPVRARLETPVRHSPLRFGAIAPMFNMPLVDAVALKDPAEGSLSVSLINRDLRRAIELQITLNGLRPRPQATRYLYSDDFPIDKAAGPFKRPRFEAQLLNASQVFTVSLPPHSVTLLKIGAQE